MRANRRLLLLVMAGLTFAGLAGQHGELAALALPLLVYLGAALWYAPAQPVLSASRALERSHARPGQKIGMAVSVRNTGGGLEEVTLQDSLPLGVRLLDGRARVLMALPAGAEIELRSSLAARRGEFEFGGLAVEASETFGLYSTSLTVAAPPARPEEKPKANGLAFSWREARAQRVHLSVEPVGEALRPFVLRPPQTRGFAGPVASRQGGRGTDFFTVRQYQAGDSLRQINWKASSRSERAFYTNVFEQQRIADVGIILDAREQADLRSAEGGSLFEYSVRAAASLVGPILKAGNRLGLLVYGPGMESVFPGYGKVQQQRIQQALARTQTGHNFALESLAHLPTRFFPAGSEIILISPLLSEDPPWVARLRALGYGVLVISPDALAFELPEAKEDELAYRLARAERRFQLQQLQRAGVMVVDWDVHRPLAALVAQVTRRAR